jgi:myo-inositol-1(or 4)-monophosphatase
MAAASAPGRAGGRDLGRSTAFGPELALAIELAHRAGQIQMDRYERLERVEAKGPRDVVTEVDHLCEALVMEAVRARYPDDAFHAEEIGEVAAAGEAKSDRVWIVDPLDGTINYANGIPFFCISIALVADGRPVVGVVYDPTRDETFASSIDGPSLRNGEPIRVGRKELLADLVVTLAVGGRGTVRKRREALKSIRANRSMGCAALTLAYVACGRFDVYAQGAGISAWDVAAAGLIAERAGATVTSLDGGPWFDLERPARKWSCLAAAPGHHAAMLKMLR